MAEQDFVINVRTTADTAAVARMEAALTSLGAKVNSINAAGGGAGAEGGAGLLDKAASKIEHGIFRTAVHAIGIGVVYELVGALREVSKEIEKTSEELTKQGEHLSNNAKLYGEAALYSKDQADVIKIANAALKDVETTQKKLNDLAIEDIGIWEQFSNVVNKTYRYISGGDPNKVTAPLEEARAANLKTAADQAAAAAETAIYEISRAQIEAKKRSTQSLDEATKDLNQRIKEQEALASQHLLKGEVQDYVDAANKAAAYAREIDALAAAHDKLTEKTKKYVETADPQVQAILANEKAMFEARAAGREQDASAFERSALALRAGARPDQLADVAKIYSSKEVVDALKELGQTAREQVNLWK